MHFIIEKNNFKIECDVIKLGNDFNVSLYGGDKSHIGSVVLAIPRESLTGEGISVTTSILNCTGHKDDILAKMFSEELAVSKNAKVSCSCGVHINNATSEQIENIITMCREMLREIIGTNIK